MLHPGKLPTVLGATLVILGPLVSLLIFATVAPGDAALVLWGLGPPGAISALGMLIIARGLSSLVLVTPFGVVQRRLFEPSRHLAWRNVVAVRYRSSGTLQLLGKATSISVGTMMIGFTELLDALERELPGAVAGAAVREARNGMAKTLGAV